MNIAEYSIKNPVISWMLAIILLGAGISSFSDLSRLEDPEFTIKDALIITQYPGASPEQVEEEVTYPLENAIQELPYVDFIRSISSTGLSQITVTMQRTYGPDDLPQIWDELRRKVNDLTPSLPPGVLPPLIKDDFGDIFGLMYSIVGDGFSYKEITDYVDYLKRELVLIEGVGKVEVAGQLQEQVFVEISRSKLALLSIPYSRIYEILAAQNIVSNAGAVKLAEEYIRFHPTGEFQDVSELGDLVVSSSGGKKLIYLKDVASITRGFEEVPSHINSLNGREAITLGISFASGFNVVEVGAAVEKRLLELEYTRPVGIEVAPLYDQPKLVSAAVDNFLVNLAEAVAIVIVVLLIFMGVRSGLLIGLILLITVIGSFIFMKMIDIELQRISLGALIIALGMLVDNAIVVTEGILIGMKRGLSKLEAASSIVKQTMWPLFGATVIAITAFAPIGLSDDATGEILGSLFYVLLISLMLSWFTAITLTPFFANLFFKEDIQKGITEENADPYAGLFFMFFRKILDVCMRFRIVTVVVAVALLVASGYGFQKVKIVFFPYSTTPMLLVDYWRTQGSDIRETFKDIQEIERWLVDQEGVVRVSSSTGRGGIRFMLTYAPEKMYASYGQLMIELEDVTKIDSIITGTKSYLDEHYSNAMYTTRKFELGPVKDAKIEARFSGPDPDVLRNLGIQAKVIMRKDASVTGLRDDWGMRSKLVRPQFSEVQARRTGVSKQDLDDVLLMSFSGKSIGLYRDGTTLLPIIARPPASERLDIDSLPNLQIWSPVFSRYLPIEQVVSGFKTQWEDSIINRRDRKRTLTVLADPDILGDDTTDDVLTRLRPQIEAIPLEKGYSLSWGGDYESSVDANEALMGTIPFGVFLMFLITVFLFSTLRQPLIVWSTAPLALIGVTTGLLLTNTPFTFMALLGFIALVGMMLKNGIVLVDQINLEITNGKPVYYAIFDAAVSRVRPVSMAMITTVLGMIPLLFDGFFKSMAVTIMFGLGFATVFTLIIVPVMYLVLYRVNYEPLKTGV